MCLFAAILFLSPLLSVSLAEEGGASPRDRAAWARSSTGLPAAGNFYGVTFADINKDGKLDIIAAPDGAGVKVYLGDGAGCWTALSPQPPATGGSDVRVGDITSDGNPDIVSGSSSSQNGVHLYRGNGTGGFTEITSGSGVPTSGNWRGIALGDVNKDGKLDIATTNGYSGTLGIRVYVGDGTGKFTNNSTGLPTSGERDSGVVLVDFNGDGNLDLAAGGAAGATCFLGNGGAGGAMSWTGASTGLPADRFTGVNATDANNDGLPDIVLGSYGPNIGVRVYRNVNNASSWTSMSTGLPNRGHFIDVSSGDFDSDGNADLVFGNYSGPGIRCFYGNGAGSWTENSTGLCATDSYVGNEVGDFNGDGSPDLVIASYSNKGILAFKNLHSAPPQPVLALLSPVGNLSWSGGSQHLIGWNVSSGSPPYSLNLSYSTDGGGNFTNPIVSGLAQAAPGPGSYPWDVPMIDSNRTRVRVTVKDSQNQTASNSSPFDLEIDSVPPGVILTEPADGAQNVSNSIPVLVRFSEMMNLSAAQSAVSITGPGSPSLQDPAWLGEEVVFGTLGLLLESMYTVTVAASAKDDSDPGNPMAAPFVFTFNTSDAPLPYIDLFSPAGGEVWLAGSDHDINWTAAGGTGALDIALSYSAAGPDGPWTLISAGEANDGGYRWTVPMNYSANCFVNATVADSLAPPKRASDRCSSPFTIKEAPIPLSVDLTSPEGGEVWFAGSRQDITWNATGGNGDRTVAIQISTSGAAGPWTTAAANEADDGRFEWTVPDAPTNSCIVKATVTDSYDPPQMATAASSPFTIKEAAVPLAISLLSPNGGENWTAGTRHDITWSSSGGNGERRATVEYSTTGPGPWTPIASDIADAGTLSWTVPNVTSADCLVRVTVRDGYDPPQTASDRSDDPFMISGPPPPPPPDTQPPSPVVSWNRSNDTYYMEAQATDNVAVTRIEILIDGMAVAWSNSSICIFTWNVRRGMEGNHTVEARAYDAAGNMGRAVGTIAVEFPAPRPPEKQTGFLESYWWALAAMVVFLAVAVLAALLMRRKPPENAPQSAPPPQAPAAAAPGQVPGMLPPP